MKKRISGALGLLMFFSIFLSCAEMGPRKQIIRNNTYTSTSNPSLDISVRNELKYLGNFKSSDQRSWRGGADQIHFDTHVFADVDHNTITRAIFIYIVSQGLSYSHFGEDCTMVENAFSGEYVNLSSNRFCNIVTIYDGNSLSTRAGRPIVEGGYTFNQYYLSSRYSKLISANREIFAIEYIETLEPKFYSQRWVLLSKDKLSGIENQRLSEFMKNGENAFAIIDKQTSPTREIESAREIDKTIDPINECSRELNGLWEGRIVNKSPKHICADRGSFKGQIQDCHMTGQLTTSNQLVLQIDGNVDIDGKFVGGIASNERVLGSFTGSFTVRIGSGTWQDNYGCYGTWEAAKISTDEGCIEERLNILKDLYDKGLIGETEFIDKKKALLDEL